jgi:hypothetical protein
MLPPNRSVEERIDNYLVEDEDDNGNQIVVRGGNPPYGNPPYGYPPYGYPPYGYPPYGYPPYGYQGNIKKTSENRNISKLAYEIVIDMELHPGTSLTPQQINESKCNSKYNAIRKAFSEFTGRPYVIPPVYKTTQTKKNVGGRQNRITRKRH